MSLLTEEQINDILDIANVCSSSSSAKKLIEWNKMQTSTQIEPDWTKAADNAVSAVVHVTWVTKLGTWVGSHPVATFERPAPVITPHPHAEILAKYAEVAARRIDPWVEFEFKHKFNENWAVFICHPHFAVDYEYRHIGDKK